MKKIQFAAVLLLAFLTACADTSSNTSAMPSTANESIAVSKGRMTDEGGGGGGGGKHANEPLAQQVSLNQAENSRAVPNAIERKIIRNADLQLETEAIAAAQQKITDIAEIKTGFVVESAQSTNDVKSVAPDVVTMTVRVPAEKFNETLDEIRRTGTRVVSETVKGQDVTEEFIDIEARLRAQKALEQQFVEIMKQAKTVEDALNVQRELADVRGEIEKIEGRKQFLENQANLSTIKVRLQTPAAFSASSTSFFYRVGQSLTSGFDFALNFILVFITFLVAILPFLLFIVLPIYLISKYLWRKRSRQKPASEVIREELNNG